MSHHSPPLEIEGVLLLRNTALNLAAQLPVVLAAILVTPVVLGRLGPDQFGVLALVWTAIGYFGLFDLGLGRAATRYAAAEVGRGDLVAAGRIIRTSALMQLGVGAAMAIVAAALTPFAAQRVLNIPLDVLPAAVLSFYLAAPIVPIVMLSGSFRGALEARQRFDLVNWVRVPSNTSLFIAPLIGVLLQWDLPRIVALIGGSRLLSLGAFILLYRRIFPNGQSSPMPSPFPAPKIHRREFPGTPVEDAGSSPSSPFEREGRVNVPGAVPHGLPALLRFGGWLTVSSVIDPILGYLDRFMIGALVSMAAVTYYAVPSEVATKLLIIPASAVSTLFPAFSTLAGQGRSARAGALATKAVGYLIAFLGPVLVLAAIYARDILTWWLGPPFAARSAPVLQLLLLGVLVNSVSQVPFALVQALGRPDLTAKFHSLELPVHVLVLWKLVSLWGPVGAAAAWVIRIGLDAILLFGASAGILFVRIRDMIGGKVVRSSVLLLVWGAGAYAVSLTVNRIWLGAAVIGATAVLVTARIWLWISDPEDRARIVRLLRAVATIRQGA